MAEIDGVLDYLGVKMTSREIEQLKKRLSEQCSNTQVPLEAIELALVSILSGYNQDALLEAFKLLGGDKTGTIPSHELKHYLESYGAPMSKEDMEMLLSLAPTDKEGNIDCQQFSAKVAQSYN